MKVTYYAYSFLQRRFRGLVKVSVERLSIPLVMREQML